MSDAPGANEILFKGEAQVCGGASVPRPASEETQRLCNAVRADLEAKAGKKFDVFIAKEYSTQIVAGINHFIRIDVGGSEFVHVRLFQPLSGSAPSNVQLISFQPGKTSSDKLSYF